MLSPAVLSQLQRPEERHGETMMFCDKMLRLHEHFYIPGPERQIFALVPQAYGGPMDLTPNLDRMSRDSVRFERAFTAQPVCAPAVVEAAAAVKRAGAKIVPMRDPTVLPKAIKNPAEMPKTGPTTMMLRKKPAVTSTAGMMRESEMRKNGNGESIRKREPSINATIPPI